MGKNASYASIADLITDTPQIKKIALETASLVLIIKLNELGGKRILLHVFESLPTSIEAEKPAVLLELHQLKEDFNDYSQTIAKEREFVGKNAGWTK